MNVLVVLAAVLACVASESIAFKNCTKVTNPGSAASVSLSPCTSQPCNFKKGDTVIVTIDFTAQETSSTLKATVYGIVFGIPVPFPLPNPDACTNSNITCPIQKGQSYTYSSNFKVLDEYPDINVIVMWRLDGAVNDVCFTFPMSISG
ncbi:NPC intracellular cholesterol transporter 2 [Aplysia californica]|uniref:NPC intracellular cholesterol transporter 2 n=1 Tax=Aplysia californica TaxID=6500 RepID=A0ABM0K9L2_APLCA|nr:NPC intracellular cholesterol transporter 2 [Aplysia californica]